MKKCKTCKHWKLNNFGLGECSGILAKSMIIPIPDQPKGKPNGKLVVSEGITASVTSVITKADWNCKNWRMK